MSCMALVTVLILIAGFFYIYSTVQLPIKALSVPLNQSSQVYFSDGKTLVGCFCSTNRTSLSSQDLGKNKYLEQAFFAAEDRHYLTEGGISLTGTARAILVDLTGKGYQGGSTITEQFVKTYFDPTGTGNLTYKEKIKEIVDAIKLSKLKDKQWILTHYLNAIYLGNGAYGVEAAAETYFGIHAWQVDPAQAAMLAAMVQAPSAFAPHSPTENVSSLGYSLLDRWVSVLQNMAGDTYPSSDRPVLTQAQLHKLVPDPNNHMADRKNFPKVLKANSDTKTWKGFRGYIMSAVLRELESKYNYKADEIGSMGLQIVTTFNLKKMQALYSAVYAAKKLMRGYGRPLPWYAHVGAILENPKNGAIEASYGGPDYTAKHCKRLFCTYDMAMQSRNQVGSSFKPYVLAAAVKQGMNVATSKLNGYWPICVPPDTMPLTRSKPWKTGTACPTLWLGVKPDPVSHPGPMSVKDAAALSSNPAFEDLTHRVGTNYIIKLAKKFGVDISHATSKAHPNSYGSGLTDDVGKIGIALGIAPLTVEEQATTFATLADDGVYHTPHVIAQITLNGRKKPIKVDERRVLSHAQVADVDWALSYDTIFGTGVPNAVLSPARPTIAKTGTTDVAQSAFFIGAMPRQYSLAVGMFTNSQNNTAGGQTLDVLPSVNGTGGGFGGAWPATIWRLAMERLLRKDHAPVAQLSPLDLNGFQKWIQAKPPQKKKCKQPGFGGGPGNGNGNGHGNKGQPCISPSPNPSGPPTPNPSPSGFPSPSPSGSPSASPSPSAGGGLPASAAATQSQSGRSPAHRQAASTPSLTTAAILPQSPSGKPAWVATTTGLT